MARMQSAPKEESKSFDVLTGALYILAMLMRLDKLKLEIDLRPYTVRRNLGEIHDFAPIYQLLVFKYQNIFMNCEAFMISCMNTIYWYSNTQFLYWDTGTNFLSS